MRRLIPACALVLAFLAAGCASFVPAVDTARRGLQTGLYAACELTDATVKVAAYYAALKLGGGADPRTAFDEAYRQAGIADRLPVWCRAGLESAAAPAFDPLAIQRELDRALLGKLGEAGASAEALQALELYLELLAVEGGAL